MYFALSFWMSWCDLIGWRRSSLTTWPGPCEQGPPTNNMILAPVFGYVHCRGNRIINRNWNIWMIWGSHSASAKVSRLLGCDYVPLGEWFPVFRRTIMPSTVRIKQDCLTYPRAQCHIPGDLNPQMRHVLAQQHYVSATQFPNFQLHHCKVYSTPEAQTCRLTYG